MCIIIHQDPGTELVSDSVLEHCAKSNPDGMGIMFPLPQQNKVEIFRSMDDLDQLMNIYKSRRAKGDPVSMHFRIKTHGAVDINNCHPFRITRGMALMHNGTIGSVTSKVAGTELSDTQWFAENILKKLPNPETDVDNEAIQEMIYQMISSSRILLMKSDGQVWIWNKKRGTYSEEEKAWFSHHGFRSYGHSAYCTSRPAVSRTVYGSQVETTREYINIERKENAVKIRLARYRITWEINKNPTKWSESEAGSFRVHDVTYCNDAREDAATFVCHGKIYMDGTTVVFNRTPKAENRQYLDSEQYGELSIGGSVQRYPTLIEKVGTYQDCQVCTHSKGTHTWDKKCGSANCDCEGYVPGRLHFTGAHGEWAREKWGHLVGDPPRKTKSIKSTDRRSSKKKSKTPIPVRQLTKEEETMADNRSLEERVAERLENTDQGKLELEESDEKRYKRIYNEEKAKRLARQARIDASFAPISAVVDDNMEAREDEDTVYNEPTTLPPIMNGDAAEVGDFIMCINGTEITLKNGEYHPYCETCFPPTSKWQGIVSEEMISGVVGEDTLPGQCFGCGCRLIYDRITGEAA